jgi:hypothetical protein
MTNRERAFAALGLEHSEGIEQSLVIVLPTGREVRREGDGWIVQPPNDNYWQKFHDLLAACKYGLCGRRK